MLADLQILRFKMNEKIMESNVCTEVWTLLKKRRLYQFLGNTFEFFSNLS